MSLKHYFRFAVVESVLESDGSDRPVRVKLKPTLGQIFPRHLAVACPRRLLDDFPVGTRFRLKLKLAQKPDGGHYLLADPNVPPQVTRPSADLS